MYKAGYDPNAYVAFFSKVIEEERRSPGTIPSVFSSHPPTPDRILKSEEEIKAIIPKREQYLVSNSEFDDMKARLQAVISNRRRLHKGDSGPTLRKREASTDSTTTAPGPSDKGKDDGGDKPPVLHRRDN
jgi:predicted Zn-dependent protease